MIKIKKVNGGSVEETPEQKLARYIATYGSRGRDILQQEELKKLQQQSPMYYTGPRNTGYEPTQAVKNTKAALAAVSLGTGAGTNPLSYLANVAGSVYDFGTAARYAADGQWENAYVDATQGVIGLLPGLSGRLGLKGDQILTQGQKIFNSTLKGTQAVNEGETISEAFNNGGKMKKIKYADGGTPPSNGRRRRTSSTATISNTPVAPANNAPQAFAQYNFTDLEPSYQPEISDDNRSAGIIPTMAQNPVDQDSYAWTKAYINSPKYKERLGNFWAYPDYVQRQRANKVSNIGFVERNQGGSSYTDNSAYPNQLQINPGQVASLNTTREDVTTHEIGHATNASDTNPALRVNPVEEKYILDRNRSLQPGEYQQLLDKTRKDNQPNISNYLTSPNVISERNHDIAPSEILSDIQALRYNLNKAGIYDARTQDITPEQLQKAKQNKAIMSQFGSSRLFKAFDDKGLIDILNKVAVNNANPTINTSNIANDGGGLSRKSDYGSKKRPYPKVSKGDFAGGGRSYPIPTRADAVDALRLAGLHGRSDVKAKVYAKYPDLKKKKNDGGYITFNPDIYNDLYPDGPMTDLRLNDGGNIYAQKSNGFNPIAPQRKNPFNPSVPIANFGNGNGFYTEAVANDGINLPYMPNAVSTPGNEIWYQDPMEEAQKNITNYFNNPQNNQPINDATLNGDPSLQTNYVDQTVGAEDNTNQGPSRGQKIGQAISGMLSGVTLSTAPLITGTATIANLATQGKQQADEYARRVRRYSQQDVYNPIRYGTGSQAIMNDGGIMDQGPGKKLTPKEADARYKALYGPVENKINRAINKIGFDKLPEMTQIMLNETMGQFDNTVLPNGKPRNIPPVDDVIKNAQTDLLNLSDVELERFLKTDWTKVKTIGEAMRSKPSSMSVFDLMKYYNKFNKLKKSGYTFNDGGTVNNMKPLADNQFSSPIYEFVGPKHEEGGIDINYQGTPVEVEGGETVFMDNGGDLNVFGNMIVPGTNKKFKAVSKNIAKIENKTQYNLDKSVDLVNQNDPTSRYGKYRFNAGKVMMGANSSKLEELNEIKNELSDMQNMMLEAGHNEESSKSLRKMKYGGKIPGYRAKYDDGGELYSPDELYGDPTQSLAQRNNNPGNIMYKSDSKYQKDLGAVKGDPRYDSKGKIIGYFAKFPSIEAGQEGMRRQLFNSPSYRDLTVDQAARRWVHGSQNSKEAGYTNIPSSLANKKIKDLTPEEQLATLHTFTVGEDSKKYNWEGITPPSTQITRVGLNTPRGPIVNANVTPPARRTATIQDLGTTPFIQSDIPPNDRDTTPSKRRRSSVPFGQILPELLTVATERPEFVPGQTYEPNLYTPYQVSFQDRLNENNSTFRALQIQNSNNPALVSQLAGQKYEADSRVLADEFRTNQQIQNQITNQNTELLNQAQLQNIQLTDQQMVRQSQARSNTRENIRNAINSISSKANQARLEDQTLAVYENMFPHFTYDGDGNLKFQDVQKPTFSSGLQGGGNTLDDTQRSRVKYDASGKVKETVVTTPSKRDQTKLDLQIDKARTQRLGLFKSIFGGK